MDLHDVTSHRVAHDRVDLALTGGETLLAGGTWLFSEPQPGVTGLVDLTGLGWPDLEVSADGGLRVAATCTVAGLVAGVGDLAPGLTGLVRTCADALLMSFKVQASATVGGNVCLALPAGAMTSLFAGLGAEAVVWCPDGTERREPVTTFVRDVRLTSLAPGEVLRALDVPASVLTAPVSVRRQSLTRIGRSAAVVVGTTGEAGPRLVLTAASTRPVVLTGPDHLAAVDCWYEDAHGAADWRAAVTAVLVDEVLAELEEQPWAS